MDVAPRSCSRHVLVTYCGEDLQRPRIEQFIQRAFAQRHGATVRAFMPTLLALEGRGNRICGVVGFRNAAAEPLFLERYLQRPVELVLGERLGRSIERERIVEVGNLAGMSCRAAVHLVTALPRVLLERGNQWIVFTATSAVRGVLDKLHAPMIELGSASREHVASAEDWGSYYDNDPRVMAGYLPDGVALAAQGLRS